MKSRKNIQKLHQIRMFEQKKKKNFQIEESSRIEPILFGSEIYFRLTEKKEWFLYSDGFIDTGIKSINLSKSVENIPIFGI